MFLKPFVNDVSVSFLSVCTSLMASVIVVYLPSRLLLLPIAIAHTLPTFSCLCNSAGHRSKAIAGVSCVCSWGGHAMSRFQAPFVRLSGLHQPRSLVNSCLVDSLVISGKVDSSSFLVYICGSHVEANLVMQTFASFCLRFIFRSSVLPVSWLD